MSEGALRGTRLGASSFETDDNVILAPRQIVTFDCPNGHHLEITMSNEAEIPATWTCHCGMEAQPTNTVEHSPETVKSVRSHWDMLRERRSIEELEELLAERLEILREADAYYTRQTA